MKYLQGLAHMPHPQGHLRGKKMLILLTLGEKERNSWSETHAVRISSKTQLCLTRIMM